MRPPNPYFTLFFSLNLPRNSALKNGGDFGEFYLVSVSQETMHENSSKIRGKFGAKFGAKSGRKFEKFVEISFCNFSEAPKSWTLAPSAVRRSTL